MAKGGGGIMNPGAGMFGGTPPAPPGVSAPYASTPGGGPPPLPGAPAGQPAGPDPQRMAMIEQFERNAMRGNREGRALSPGQIQMAVQSMMAPPPPGGGAGSPGGMETVITPGGGNQNAFSPQPATVTQRRVAGRGGGGDQTMRLQLAQLMNRAAGPRKYTSTGDRGGHTTSGR